MDGELIGADETYESLELEDQDLIDCEVLQNSVDTVTIAGTDTSADTITVRVEDQAGDETDFIMNITMKMAKLFKTYATIRGIQGKTDLHFRENPKQCVKPSPTNLISLFLCDPIDLLLHLALLFFIFHFILLCSRLILSPLQTKILLFKMYI